MTIQEPEEDRRMNIERRSFKDCPRFDRHELSEDQIVSIAKRAVVLARGEFYTDVGKSVVEKFFWIVGALTVGIIAYLQSHGIIKIF